MTVKIEIAKGRISVAFEYNPFRVDAIKQIAGRRFDANTKTWTVPLDTETCHDLRNKFGDSLEIGPQLRSWFLAEKTRTEEIIRVSEMDLRYGCDLERVPKMAPFLWAAMERKGYQPPAVKFGAMVRNPLIADAPGLGKTIETLGTLIESGTTGRILIVAPRTSLRATWEPEIHKWLCDYKGNYSVTVVDANTGKKQERQAHLNRFNETGKFTDNDLTFLVVNPEMLRAKRIDGKIVYDYPEFQEIEWDAIIVDESHRYLLNANPNAKGCSQWGLGLAYLRVVAGGQKIALSGTPMKGKPRKIWHTLRWLNPELYPSEWSWAKKYFQTVPNFYSATGEQITDTLKPEMEAAFGRELAKVMIRRTKDQLHLLNPDWAPKPKQYFEVWLPMAEKQSKLYAEMLSDTQATINSQVLTANGVLAILTRLKQFATSAAKLSDGEFFPDMPSNKIEWLIDDFIPSRETKIVIASQYSKVIDLLAEQLYKAKIGHFKLTGATPDADRQNMIYQFQNFKGSDDEKQVFLLTTTAGGVSITLDAADDLVLLDETWVPDDQEQVEDRIHRTSNTEHQVNIWYVRSLGTIEQEIAETVEEKDESQKRVLDGRRGIDYAKKKFKAEIKGDNKT